MPETSRIRLRLIHDGVQPGPAVAEPVDFGIQDKKGETHAGKPSKGRLLQFNIDIAVTTSGQPVFSGPFAHGPPAGRFLYLSWKKRGRHEHPWAWRIKMPLSNIDPTLIRQAQKPGHCLEADVVGRRPHSSETVVWRVGRSA